MGVGGPATMPLEKVPALNPDPWNTPIATGASAWDEEGEQDSGE